jgi:hypothetical protein
MRDDYVQGHWQKFFCLRGEKHPRWRGGTYSDHNGELAYTRDGGYEYVHRARAEVALGRCLDAGETVFRADISGPKETGNLVVGMYAYGRLIQRRARALQETGDANKRWCGECGTWDDPSKVKTRADGHSTSHRECLNFAAGMRARGQRLEVEKGQAYRAAALAWQADKDAERAERVKNRTVRQRKMSFNRQWKESAYRQGR